MAYNGHYRPYGTTIVASMNTSYCMVNVQKQRRLFSCYIISHIFHELRWLLYCQCIGCASQKLNSGHIAVSVLCDYEKKSRWLNNWQVEVSAKRCPCPTLGRYRQPSYPSLPSPSFLFCHNLLLALMVFSCFLNHFWQLSSLPIHTPFCCVFATLFYCVLLCYCHWWAPGGGVASLP